jgi:hypothetical protein
MQSSCELTIRFGVFEGVACGTSSSLLLSAIIFALIGLAAYRMRLKWRATSRQDDSSTPESVRAQAPKPIESPLRPPRPKPDSSAL